MDRPIEVTPKDLALLQKQIDSHKQAHASQYPMLISQYGAMGLLYA